jgi:hypothetical protein
LIGAASGLLVSCLVALFGYRAYVRQRRHEQEALLSALFGELANLYEHCIYVAYELPSADSDPNLLKRRLQWGKYGSFRFANDVTRYGFLNASDIRLLLQLSLRVRNTDQLFDLFLVDLTKVTQGDLSYSVQRLKYTIATAEGLMSRLVERRPKLASIVDSIKKDLPAI